jgi:hypothetical protein
MSTQTIALTFDIDWAPEEVIQDTINILADFNAKATFFATHESEILKNVNPSQFEIGIHPNFNGLISGSHDSSYKKVVDEILSIYPSSVGTRSHSLFQSSHILDYIKSVGLKYDSNLLLPYSKGLKPFYYPNKLIRIPYFWEDDVHFIFNRPFKLSDVELDPEINIFDFHPIHVFLNTECEYTYSNVKQYYQQPEMLIKGRNTSVEGTRDFLIEVLEYVKHNNLTTIQLKELI